MSLPFCDLPLTFARPGLMFCVRLDWDPICLTLMLFLRDMSQGPGIYCFAVEAGLYSNVVECLPVDSATWVRFPAGAGWIFSLYNNGTHRKKTPII